MGITKKDVVLEVRSLSQEKQQVIKHGRHKKLLRQHKGIYRFKSITGSIIETENKGVTNTTAAPYYNKERIETVMTNQEVFEMLSENEARLFYAYCDDRDNEALKAAHESVKQALINFARDTGCHL